MPGEAAINESFLTLCFVWGSGLILTWLLSRFLTGISGKIAVRFGIISRVTGRSSHSVPIPRLGGIGAILALLAASCAGFLALNRPPARIFMGDGGSLAIGYLLGSLVVVFSRELAAMDSMAWLTGMTVLVPFIFDVLLTLVRRWKNRENLMQAHREHLYQRLMITGMGHEAVLRLNIRYFIVCGALALAGQQFGGGWGRVIAGLLAAAVMLHYWHGVLRLEQEKKIGP